MTWMLPATDTYFRPILAATPIGFEIDHLDFALQYVSKYRVAVDGGAHIGTWSCRMADHFERVLAFEPALDTFDCLVENTKELRHKVVAFHAALGEITSKCNLSSDPSRPGNTGARMVVPDGGTVTPMVALDNHRLQYLDFLKLDVEGYEVLALVGAVQTIAKHRPVIMVECKEFAPPRLGGPAKVRSFLANLRYEEVGGIRNDRVFVPRS